MYDIHMPPAFSPRRTSTKLTEDPESDEIEPDVDTSQRKPSSEGRSIRFNFLLTQSEKVNFTLAAHEQGLSLSAWLRMLASSAADSAAIKRARVRRAVRKTRALD
jgi:hypothetical protein